MSTHLPPWLVLGDDGVFYADPDGFYPYYLGLMKVDGPTQYHLEIAYQMMKLDVQVFACSNAKTDPRRTKRPVPINVIGGDRKSRWAMANFRKGKGAAAATRQRKAGDLYGSDVRECYMKLRAGQHPLLGRRRDPIRPEDEIKPDGLILP